MNLSENIRKTRKEKSLTQEQLAEAMGVSAASVSKWETGQAAPELSVLSELADFFEMSVDTLIGHEISPCRMEEIITGANNFVSDGQYGKASDTAEKLVRRYPNSYKAVENASNVFQNIAVLTMDSSYTERAVELTKRLFSLLDDGDVIKRFELLKKLANQYELMENWDMAQKYYKESNVGGANNRALSRCLANAGKNEEALAAVSDVFYSSLFDMITDTLLLEQLWEKLGQPEKAKAAMSWSAAVLDAVECDSYSLLNAAINAKLAVFEEKQGERDSADLHVRKAVKLIKNEHVPPKETSFLKGDCLKPELRFSKSPDLSGIDLLLDLLNDDETGRLSSVAREEAQK
ncbi:MAG: helix-turn-helix domain-containing protein [Oscillospiraceae bacterium]